MPSPPYSDHDQTEVNTLFCSLKRATVPNTVNEMGRPHDTCNQGTPLTINGIILIDENGNDLIV